jgi:hypothetical protein
VDLVDGLYQVETRYFCAGFIVKQGKVKTSECAPILRRKIWYWATLAWRIGE